MFSCVHHADIARHEGALLKFLLFLVSACLCASLSYQKWIRANEHLQRSWHCRRAILNWLQGHRKRYGAGPTAMIGFCKNTELAFFRLFKLKRRFLCRKNNLIVVVATCSGSRNESSHKCAFGRTANAANDLLNTNVVCVASEPI